MAKIPKRQTVPNLIPYLVFLGNCKEAMEFYAECFQGEIASMQTFGDSQLNVPKEAETRIFDSELKAGNIHFKASDDLPSHPVKSGTNISLFLTFSDDERKKKTFKNLSEEGDILFPLDENFGMLRDKYGIQWMFTHEK